MGKLHRPEGKEGKTMRYLSMFAGVGGFELGIERAVQDAECIGFSEIDKHAIAVYRLRFPGVKEYGNARNIDTKQLPDIDCVCGGFPCQAFSMAGKRRGFKDTRGTLFFEIARIAKDKRPSVLLCENVRGLLNHKGGQTFETILNTMGDLGYHAEWQLLDSRNHGVPQHRERVYIVGHSGEQCQFRVFPIRASEPAHEGRNRKSDRVQVSTEQNRELGKWILKVMEALNVKVIRGWWSENFLQGQEIHHEDNICRTILAGDGNKSIPWIVFKDGTIRKLTPIEYERLQAFKDNWTQHGIDEKGKTYEMPSGQRYKQMGNSVTTNVVEVVARKIWPEDMTQKNRKKESTLSPENAGG